MNKLFVYLNGLYSKTASCRKKSRKRHYRVTVKSRRVGQSFVFNLPNGFAS